MRHRIIIEADMPPGMELAWKEVLAMAIEERMGQNVRVVAVEPVTGKDKGVDKFGSRKYER